MTNAKIWILICIGIGYSVTYILSDCQCKAERGEANNNKCNVRSKDVILDRHYSRHDMVRIDGGQFEMGTDEPIFVSDNESPARKISVDSFYMDKYEVSNRQFSKFMKLRQVESSFKTDAELFGNSFVFDNLMCDTCIKNINEFRVAETPWWVKVNGAYWKKPFCNHSTIKDIMDHPVVHVSWNDAYAYCQFYDKRLPTEQEWEFACRSGLEQNLFPWGNDEDTSKRANVWQGNFPETNRMSDGYFGTAPVDAFEPNTFGLYNIIGNVWEWTNDSWNPKTDEMVKKGGSFLCSKNYCYRYRCAARSQNSRDTSASNIGFRCVSDIDKYDAYFSSQNHFLRN